MAADHIQGKMARGALWMMLLTFVDRSISLVSTLFLVRVLAPADFGIVAMALSFIFFAQLLSAFGFDVALIHNRNATEEHYHSAWTLNAILGTTILLLTLVAAKPVADFYNEPRVFWVLCALALWPFIGGLENIGVVTFRKDLDFHKEFAFQISRKIVSFLVVVPLAFLWRNHWALVAGSLAQRLAGTIASYLVHPFRPRFSVSEARSLLSFSKWLLLNNVLVLLKDRSSDFVLGRLSGPAALGVYNVTFEFSNLPTTEIGAPINRALLPGFAKLAEGTEVVSSYFNAISLVALLAIPTAAGTLAIAPYFVPVALGEKWLTGVPLMEILACGSAFFMMQASVCAVLIARGHPGAVTKTNALFVALLIALLLALAPRFGAIGAAWAALISAAVTLPAFLYQLRAKVGVPMATFLRAIARPVIASVLMVPIVRWIIPEYTVGMPFLDAFRWFAIGILAGAAAYPLFVLLLWTTVGRPDGAERHVLNVLRQQFVSRVQPVLRRVRTKGA